MYKVLVSTLYNKDDLKKRFNQGAVINIHNKARAKDALERKYIEEIKNYDGDVLDFDEKPKRVKKTED